MVQAIFGRVMLGQSRLRKVVVQGNWQRYEGNRLRYGKAAFEAVWGGVGGYSHGLALHCVMGPMVTSWYAGTCSGCFPLWH